MITISIDKSNLKELAYFQRHYPSDLKGLLEKTVRYRRLGIPHEVILDDGLIMISLNWLLSKEILEKYFKTLRGCAICDKLGRTTVYTISRNRFGGVTIDGPLGEVDIDIIEEGRIIFESYWDDDNAIKETVKHLFEYDVH